MRSLHSIDKVDCSSSSNKKRSQSSSESNDDDGIDDIDDSFARFLKESIFDQPAQPGNYDNVIGKLDEGENERYHSFLSNSLACPTTAPQA